MAKENHCGMILQHLKKYGAISHFEAEEMYGCTRLAGIPGGYAGRRLVYRGVRRAAP